MPLHAAAAVGSYFAEIDAASSLGRRGRGLSSILSPRQPARIFSSFVFFPSRAGRTTSPNERSSRSKSFGPCRSVARPAPVFLIALDPQEFLHETRFTSDSAGPRRADRVRGPGPGLALDAQTGPLADRRARHSPRAAGLHAGFARGLPGGFLRQHRRPLLHCAARIGGRVLRVAVAPLRLVFRR